MNLLLVEIIHGFSFLIGMIGVLIIIIGTIRAVVSFLVEKESCFPRARQILGSHLVLGLDLFVGKDIIDIAFLIHDQLQWIDLASLVTIVAARIILTFFLLRELEEIREELAVKKVIKSKVKRRRKK